jgi:hypothetical protein
MAKTKVRLTSSDIQKSKQRRYKKNSLGKLKNLGKGVKSLPGNAIVFPKKPKEFRAEEYKLRLVMSEHTRKAGPGRGNKNESNNNTES